MRTIAIALALTVATTAYAQFSDDFDSYTDTADMQTVWGAGDGILDAAGNPGQALSTDGTLSMSNIASMPTISDAAGVVFEFDMYDDGAGNKRMGGRLDKTGWGWFDIGQYNSLPGGDGYGFREVGNSGQTWTSFPTNPAIRAGWHTFRVTVTPTDVTYEVWLAQSFTIPAAYDSLTLPRAAGALDYDEVMFGAFATPSAGGGVKIDNVSVAAVPEPASLMLLGVLALLRRR